jgi:endonuclease YncB( thermonuclease family)
MKKLIFLLLITTTAFSQLRTAVVKSVYDSDSYYVTINGVFTEIRLINADAPEVANKYTKKEAQPYALIAKDSVSKYLKGKSVKVRLHGTDKYKRTLAEVYVKVGKKYRALSYMLIAKGWGWVNTDYVKKSKLLRILNSKQVKAKKLKLGLWALENPIEPREWRK